MFTKVKDIALKNMYVYSLLLIVCDPVWRDVKAQRVGNALTGRLY